MCTFGTRVFTCGHYKKALDSPCGDAKTAKQVCDSGSEYSSTTGAWCDLPGCDKKAQGKREGPGSHWDGGFKAWDVDWTAF
ncbi:hypothetical protein BN1723_003974 [Verticillium longisporum]|uniref:Uncharacterized protein n=2 Tax=Verticillium TaxID=1036719 RepID=A0A0G4MGF5_VERLO|nr:hypothetical protein HYQ44_002643 [Verticillium longisporum]KAH6708487.1 hypothetical protein EV126DRAFT_511514 [Verticillium dahliae]KAG7149012.1 hypothetical protein HYQ46_002085 [Verticillium longisporum]PNH34865.1 hypothetical protein BJF96_g1927 [Verticillium dahliae]PNH47090.1 hypothetical protein VD0003_g8883 [Verticillium dahliae]